MMDIIRKSIRTSLMFAAVGALVAVGAPLVLTGLMGAASAGSLGTFTAASVTHLSIVFGLFGLLTPIAESLCDRVFGAEKQPAPAAPAAAPNSESRQVNIDIQQAPELSQQRTLINADFRTKVEAGRAAEGEDYRYTHR